MKFKHFIGSFVFLTAFTLSVLIVGFPIYKIRSFNAPCKKTQTVRIADTDLQIRIRQFLETDRQTGYELRDELSQLREYNRELVAEELATWNLVKKMQGVDCAELPEEFCRAWEDHVNAWNKKSKLLGQATLSNKQAIDGAGRKEYLKLDKEINQTYFQMLDVAREHGVEFSY